MLRRRSMRSMLRPTERWKGSSTRSTVVRSHLGEEIRSFLADHGLKPQDVTA